MSERRAWSEGYEAAMDDLGAHDAAPVRANPYSLTSHEESTAGTCRTCGTEYPCEVRREARS